VLGQVKSDKLLTLDSVSQASWVFCHVILS